MTEIEKIDDFKEALEKENWKIFGIGGLPETRSEAGFFSTNFEIICSRATGELDSIKECFKVNVFNVENNSKKVEDIISESSVQSYINSFASKNKIAIYLFLSSPKIEKICQENGWKLIASESNLFKRLNSKDFFFDLLEKIELTREFEILNSDKLSLEKERLFRKFGEKFVLQTFNGAGGRGTFFATRNNYDKVVKNFNLEGSQKILISFFVDGFDIAVTGCVTKNNGVVSGLARHQFVGIESIVSGKENSKHAFCGNDWSLSEEWESSIQKQAEKFTQKIGEVLQKEGYLGIFGVDFIYDKKSDVLVPLEINPRLIGSYPIETQFEMANGELPLSGFHVLDFLNVDYKIVRKMKSRNRKGFENNCSHVMLVNFFGKNINFKEGLRGGVYSLREGKINFLRKGFRLSDIKNSETEFVLTAGVPAKGYSYKENNQLMRILWARSIKIDDGFDIDKESKRVIEAVKNETKNLIIS